MSLSKNSSIRKRGTCENKKKSVILFKLIKNVVWSIVVILQYQYNPMGKLIAVRLKIENTVSNNIRHFVILA